MFESWCWKSRGNLNWGVEQRGKRVNPSARLAHWAARRVGIRVRSTAALGARRAARLPAGCRALLVTVVARRGGYLRRLLRARCVPSKRRAGSGPAWGVERVRHGGARPALSTAARALSISPCFLVSSPARWKLATCLCESSDGEFASQIAGIASRSLGGEGGGRHNAKVEGVSLAAPAPMDCCRVGLIGQGGEWVAVGERTSQGEGDRGTLLTDPSPRLLCPPNT